MNRRPVAGVFAVAVSLGLLAASPVFGVPAVARVQAVSVQAAPALRAQALPASRRSASRPPAPARAQAIALPGAAAALPVPAYAAISLPPPPPVTNATRSTLLSVVLAIALAQQIDPQAAQTASFAYVHALQQYRSGNVVGARISALEALSIASSAHVQALPPSPAAFVTAAPVQAPGLAGGLYGGDAPAIDAASFLALARGILDDCAARQDRRLNAARLHLTQAQADFAARNWVATRADAKAAIDACARPQP